ncbi:hypothetical protein C8R47DRAFT_962044, partial [Mycena vitilis]
GLFFDQPDADDVPDNFKYGTTVSNSPPQIRKAFIRKPLSKISIFPQLSTVVVQRCTSDSFDPTSCSHLYVNRSLWAFFVPLPGTLVNLGLLYWKRHSHPWNFVLVGTFTPLEGLSISSVVEYCKFELKFGSATATPFVFSSLIVLCASRSITSPITAGCEPGTASFVHLLVPFNRTLSDIVYTVRGCLVFSACVVYDTYHINRKLSPDELIMGALSLYLE